MGKGINPKTREIKDPFVIQQVSITVVDYIERLNKRNTAGQIRNARNYKMAINHFEKYIGSNRINFSVITASVIERRIKS